jgi:uncharacterized CHY-type Zn-finger protein
MRTQNEFGQKLDMDKENISNVVCPACGKTITAKTFKDLTEYNEEKPIRCEHCKQDLKLEFYKINNKLCIGIDDNLSQFKIVKRRW